MTWKHKAQKIINRLLDDTQIYGNVKIGKNTVLMCHTFVTASEGITIGDKVKIAPYCFICDCDHQIDGITNKAGGESSPITIEDGVWIGAHSIILKGVTIGKGSVIGAGSVVTNSVPAGEVWVGNPARKLKEIGAKE
jgi:acetyltransferase-like isoleucine patch superfamily enzyme